MTHSTFNPSLLDPKHLEASLVGRHQLADRLTRRFLDVSSETGKPAVLLTGPRGIGKSHLIALVAHRLRDHQSLAIAWLPEDPWGIQTFFDLLAAVLAALTSTAEAQALRTETASMLKDRPAMEAIALGKIQQALTGRNLVLVIENLDSILANLGQRGQRSWRSLLQESGGWSILAATPSFSVDLTAHNAPFFGFFSIEPLEGANPEEAIALMRRLASLDSQASDLFRRSLGTTLTKLKIDCVRHLAAGNYRILVMLYEFIRAERPGDVIAALYKTIDALTPYYQSELHRLSPQQQKIVNLVSERMAPVAVTDIAEACSLTNQVTSAQLKILKDERFVVGYQQGRETLYELAEPFLRICLDAKRNGHQPIRPVLFLLAVWFSSDELVERLNSPATDVEAQKYLDAAFLAKHQMKSEPLPIWIKSVVDRLRASPHDQELKAQARGAIEWMVLFDRWDLGPNLIATPDLAVIAYGLLWSVSLQTSTNPHYWAILATTCILLDRIDEAVGHALHGYRLDPNDVFACFVLRRAHLICDTDNADVQAASKLLVGVLAAEPDEATFLVNLGDLADCDPGLALDVYCQRYPGAAGPDPILLALLVHQTGRTEVYAQLEPNQGTALQSSLFIMSAWKSGDWFTFTQQAWNRAVAFSEKEIIAYALFFAALGGPRLTDIEKDKLLELIAIALSDSAAVDWPGLRSAQGLLLGRISTDQFLLEMPKEVRTEIEKIFHQIETGKTVQIPSLRYFPELQQQTARKAGCE